MHAYIHTYIYKTTLKTCKWYTNDKLILKYYLGCSVIFVVMRFFSLEILNEFAIAHRVNKISVRWQDYS